MIPDEYAVSLIVAVAIGSFAAVVIAFTALWTVVIRKKYRRGMILLSVAIVLQFVVAIGSALAIILAPVTP